MASPEPPRLPPALLFLDLVGVMLLAAGIAEKATPGMLVPADFQLPGYASALIMAGIGLMAPLLWHLMRRARRADRR